MKTANEETRTIIINAYNSGIATRKQLAEMFGYHIQSIGNWIRAFEREGRTAPLPKGHRKSIFTDEEKIALTALLQSNVDITLAEIRERFGKKCSPVAIHKTVVKLGFVFKKNSAGKRAGARGYNSGS